MTLYELTQAVARYRRAVLISLGILLMVVMLLMFSFEDGLGWRGGLKFESTFEIAVVSPGTTDIASTDPDSDLAGTADEFADLLTSMEAAEVIGGMSGYELGEPLNATVGTGSSIIRASVIGPSPELAHAASENAFIWLAGKIERPLDPQPVVTTTMPDVPPVSLSQPFETVIDIMIDDTLEGVSADLFVLIDIGLDEVAAIPIVDRAGQTVESPITMEPGGSLLVTLETAEAEQLDTRRLAPDPLPASAPGYPRLSMTFGPNSIVEVEAGDDGNDQPAWALAATAVELVWIDGEAATRPADNDDPQQQVQIAMITEVPTATQIGGRRAPLLGFAVLVVGVIAILTAVITVDSWRRSRDDAAVSSRSVDQTVTTRPDRGDQTSGSTDIAVDFETSPTRTPIDT